MKAENIKVNLKELKEFKKRNFRDRLDFIKFWVDYIKTHSDKEWSKQQNVIIDSQLQSARDFYKNNKMKININSHNFKISQSRLD